MNLGVEKEKISEFPRRGGGNAESVKEEAVADAKGGSIQRSFLYWCF